MGKKVAVIHTSFVSVDHLKSLFQELMPQVKMINMVDDSLLAEVMAAGQVTPGIVKRMCNYVQQAEGLGVDVILNQCSSVGEVMDIARKMVTIPIVKVDEPMAEKAVSLGKTISVIATVKSTMKPSVGLVEKTAERLGKDVVVKPCLIDGALDILMKEGNREKHNQMVISEIERVEGESDAIVLAQGSMALLLPLVQHIKKPVLTSPQSGVERVRDILNL